MGVVDCLSRESYKDTWPESEVDKKFVVATINSFHKAVDCINITLETNRPLNPNEVVLEYSRRKRVNS